MFRLVIVDDEANIRSGIKKIIKRFAPRWEVVGEAEDGIAGLREILHLQPDLAMLDMRMPGLSGMEICQMLNDQAPHIHRFFLTAYEDFQLAREAIRYNAVDYLTKPLDRAELLRLLVTVERSIEAKQEERQQHKLLHDTVRSVLPIAQQFYLQQLLLGGDVEELEYVFEAVGFFPLLRKKLDRIVVLVISPDWIEKHAFSDVDVELFLYALTQYVKEWWEARTEGIVFQDYMGQIIIIVEALTGTVQLAELLLNDIHASFKRSASAGISASYDFNDISLAYREASTAVTYRLVNGGNQVQEYEAGTNEKGTWLPLLVNMERSLERLKLGKEEEAQSALQDIVHSGDIEPSGLKVILYDFTIRIASQLNQSGLDMTRASGLPLNRWLSDIENALTHTSLMEKMSLLIHKAAQCIVKELESPDAKLLEKAKQYVNDHLAKGISLKSVADYLGMNPSYFSRWFKYATNVNFIDYLKEVRMERAKEVIKLDAHNIEEVSNLVGYADVKHFYRVFKEHTGLSPTAFRRNL